MRTVKEDRACWGRSASGHLDMLTFRQAAGHLALAGARMKHLHGDSIWSSWVSQKPEKMRGTWGERRVGVSPGKEGKRRERRVGRGESSCWWSLSGGRDIGRAGGGMRTVELALLFWK